MLIDRMEIFVENRLERSVDNHFIWDQFLLHAWSVHSPKLIRVHFGHIREKKFVKTVFESDNP